MKMQLLPPGMVFDPTDKEILSIYLPTLIANNGNVVAALGPFSDLFKLANVYSCKPGFFFLNDEPDLLGRNGQRFVFTRRQRIAQRNLNGKRPRRDVHGSEGDGFWRSSSGDKPVRDDHGRVLGFFNVLNFYEYLDRNNDYKKKSRTDGFKKTDWIMYEYRLNRDVFEEWVICKIRRTGRKGDSPATMTEDDTADLVKEIENMISFPGED